MSFTGSLHSPFADWTLCKLVHVLPETSIVQLVLSGCKITEVGIRVLARALPKCPHLETLGLRQNRIGDGILWLADALPKTGLTTLDLKSTFSDADTAPLVKALAIALSTSQIKDLNLSFNAIGKEAMEIFASWLPKTRLTSLDVSINNVGSEGAKALAAVLLHTKIVHLDLYDNNIGDQGARALVGVVHHLKSLCLGFNNIADKVICDRLTIES